MNELREILLPVAEGDKSIEDARSEIKITVGAIIDDAFHCRESSEIGSIIAEINAEIDKI